LKPWATPVTVPPGQSAGPFGNLRPPAPHLYPHAEVLPYLPIETRDRRRAATALPGGPGALGADHQLRQIAGDHPDHREHDRDRAPDHEQRIREPPWGPMSRAPPFTGGVSPTAFRGRRRSRARRCRGCLRTSEIASPPACTAPGIAAVRQRPSGVGRVALPVPPMLLLPTRASLLLFRPQLAGPSATVATTAHAILTVSRELSPTNREKPLGMSFRRMADVCWNVLGRTTRH